MRQAAETSKFKADHLDPDAPLPRFTALERVTNVAVVPMKVSPDQPHPATPPAIADHELLRCVGLGAYGEVWLARSVMGVPRAIKIVWRSHFDHARTYEREFAGLKKFEPLSRRHPGFVDILHVGRNDEVGYFYYVMELADAAPGAANYQPLTLAEFLRQRGRLPVAECARHGAALAEALGFLHGEGLAHRDIKPSNIIFVDGHPKLADIGLVAGFGDARSFVGTDGYIPPEGPGSARADLFSLGRVLYELATGKSRHEFPDLPADLRDAPDLESFAELNEIILRACAPDPQERHATATELRGELLLVDAGRSVRKLRQNERRAVTWRRFGLAALALSVIGGAVLVAERGRSLQARQRAEGEATQRRLVEDQELTARENLYAADMNLAQQAMDVGNYGRAEELLASYRPRAGQRDLRGFEWFHFIDRVRGDSLGVLRDHTEVVSSLCLTRDGQRLFSASFDSTVREWSVADLKPLRKWELPGVMFATCALSPDEQTLAFEGGNRTVTAALDLARGHWITNRLSWSSAISFAPDGQLVRGARALIFSTNGVVEFLDRNLQPQVTLEEAGGRLAFSPDGKLLATGSWGTSVRLWAWPGLKPVGTLTNAGTVMALAFSPDSRRLATVSRAGELALWDVAAAQPLARATLHDGATVWCVAFSPDGRRLATGGNDQAVRVCAAETLREERVFRGHRSEVWSVVWTADGERLISAGKDSTIRVWDATASRRLPSLSGVNARPVFSPDERWFAVRQNDDVVRVVEAQTGRERVRLTDVLEVGGFSPNGRSLHLVAVGPVWERRSTEDGSRLEALPLPPVPGTLSKRLLTADGHWYVSGLQSGEVVVQDLWRGGETFSLPGHQEMIVALAVSPTGRYLVTGSIDRSAKLWDLETRRTVHTFSGHRMAVGSVAFSLDEGLIATGGWDDVVRVWDAGTRQCRHTLTGLTEGVQDLAFAPGDRTLAVLSGSSRLTFWSLASGREAGMESLPRGVGGGWLQFSPQGRWLGAVAPGRELRLLRGAGGETEIVR